MADNDDHAPRRLPIMLLLLGIVLILLSWTPIGRLAANAVWDREDSATYSLLITENHQLRYEDPESPGLTEAKPAARQKEIEKKLDAMIEKLEYAKSRPQAWSSALFWWGAALAVLGTLTHLQGQGEG